MNDTLVILGNGFDLDLGWKTSYRDFYTAKYQNFTNLTGMSYINNMIRGDYWFDLEGYIRDCILSLSKDDIEVINCFWQICRDFIFDYLSNPRYEGTIYTTNKEGCAYAFLRKLKNASIVSFNYTDPFTKNGLEYINMIHMHGNLKEGVYKTKIGVDSLIRERCELSKVERISCIIKANSNCEKLELLFTEFKRAKNIIIYGHSLGITDSDYFKPFFKSIIANRISDKNIYIVTYDESSLQNIKDNMKSYGIDYYSLLMSNVSIKVIFTSKGKNHIDFSMMINNVSL